MSLLVKAEHHLLAANIDLGVPLVGLLEQGDAPVVAGLHPCLARLAAQHGHHLCL